MPIYEYQCQSCDNRSEAIQRLSDSPLETCDDCGGPLKKLISAPAFQFKGSGWYVTDYAGKDGGSNGKEAQEGKDGESKKDSKTEESKSDSKGSASKDSSSSSSGSKSTATEG